MSDSMVEKIVTARKDHRCANCACAIRPGTEYYKVTWLGLDGIYRYNYHLECWHAINWMLYYISRNNSLLDCEENITWPHNVSGQYIDIDGYTFFSDGTVTDESGKKVEV